MALHLEWCLVFETWHNHALPSYIQDCVPDGGLSDAVLEHLALPLLGPCRVQQLSLNDQYNVTGRGIAALAGGRFPGGIRRALPDCFAVLCATRAHVPSVAGTAHWRHRLLRIPALNVATLRSGSCFAVLERLTLDGTGADDEALPLLAPLAGTLEFISVCPTHDIDDDMNISSEGVLAAMESFARRGGKPEIHYLS